MPGMRLEDELRQVSNDSRLRELHRAGDINGLLDFALLLSYETCLNNSKAFFAIEQAAIASKSVFATSCDLPSEGQNAG